MGNSSIIENSIEQTKYSKVDECIITITEPINNVLGEITLDTEVTRYFSDPLYRKKHGSLHTFRDYIIDNNLQQYSLIAIIKQITSIDPIMKIVKQYLNFSGAISYNAVKLMQATYREETNDFHEIITPNFLYWIFRVSVYSKDRPNGGDIYYSCHILNFFDEVNPRNEKILTWMFQHLDLNPNMLINSYDCGSYHTLVRNAARSNYLTLLGVLLDKNAKLFSDTHGYLLAKSNPQFYDAPQLEYYKGAHNFAINYYTKKGDKDMIGKMDKVVGKKVLTERVLT